MIIGGYRTDENLVNKPIEGTIIAGTLKPCDLVAAFVDELKHLLVTSPNIVMDAEDYLENPDDAEWDDDMISGLVADLMDVLDAIGVKHNLYFGTTEGNGADFGFWRTDCYDD